MPNKFNTGVEEDVHFPLTFLLVVFCPIRRANVGQTLNIFLVWPTHLVKPFSEYGKHGVEGSTKLVDRLDPDVDPLYLMTLTIQLFLKLLQVSWDATVFGVYNDNFPLYIKHEDLSEIAHGSQCFSIFVIQLWILHMTETSMQAGNAFVRLDNYLKEIINMSILFCNTYTLLLVFDINILIVQHAYMFLLISTLKGFNDIQGSEFKVAARWIVYNKQKGRIECEYYYFTDQGLLEPKRMKAIHI
ncbi:hypothetical protein GmHk_09G026215 [Glycine max]|nr:hypothetical protein GmHk_09G026215 [Glycine max]